MVKSERIANRGGVKWLNAGDLSYSRKTNGNFGEIALSRNGSMDRYAYSFYLAVSARSFSKRAAQ